MVMIVGNIIEACKLMANTLSSKYLSAHKLSWRMGPEAYEDVLCTRKYVDVGEQQLPAARRFSVLESQLSSGSAIRHGFPIKANTQNMALCGGLDPYVVDAPGPCIHHPPIAIPICHSKIHSSSRGPMYANACNIHTYIMRCHHTDSLCSPLNAYGRGAATFSSRPCFD